MPDLIVTGTVTLNDITTPFGKRINQLGGSATYAALAGSKFCRVGMVSIVGRDFNADTLSHLASFIDTEGVQIAGKTLRSSFKYEYETGETQSLETQFNNTAQFNPELPEHFQTTAFHLLANLDPDKQLEVLGQIKGPHRFIAADTTNFWIKTKNPNLLKAIKLVNMLVLNESETKQFFETPSLIQAGRKALELGPEFVIIKKGEHGALLFSHRGLFAVSGYPLETVTDPTGVGDSFAGAVMGFLANQYQDASRLIVNEPMVRKAVAIACATASFTAEGFGADILEKTTVGEIRQRYEIIKKIHQF